MIRISENILEVSLSEFVCRLSSNTVDLYDQAGMFITVLGLLRGDYVFHRVAECDLNPLT